MKPVFQGLYAQPSLPETKVATSTKTSTTAPAAGISDRIQQAFDTASSSTGTSFQYLLDTAQRESALKTDAKATTSSAKGLFQFVESTWLQTLKENGASLGLSQYADQIGRDARGRYTVSDPAARKAILDLRNDPEVASLMAGAYTRQNADYLKDKLGRDASAGELYVAHFLGASGASQLIEKASASPKASAADLFPRQAAANRSIFYDKGREKTVAEVYADLTSRHGSDAPVTQPGDDRILTAFDALGATSTARTVWDPALGYADSASPTATASATRGAETGWRAAAPSDAFSAMFRTDGATSPAMAAAFWRGFGQTPAMFDVALAEDGKTADGAVASDSASAALRASQPGQILSGGRRQGPLDLSAFLTGK